MRVLCDSLVALLILGGSTSCGPVKPSSPAAFVVGSGVFVSESGQTIRADYRDDGTVTLTFSDGATKVLSQAVSGSGTMSGDQDLKFWMRPTFTFGSWM